MINIWAKYNGEPFRLTAEGHADAGRNDEGHDLVCCAVSTLIQTLAFSCANLPGVRTDYRKASGFSEILITGTEAHWDTLVPRFEMAIGGLTILAAQYPQNISLTVEE